MGKPMQITGMGRRHDACELPMPFPINKYGTYQKNESIVLPGSALLSPGEAAFIESLIYCSKIQKRFTKFSCCEFCSCLRNS
jgi:hypothetical protein